MKLKPEYNTLMHSRISKSVTGAVAVEYLIGLIFIVIVLLIPIPTQQGKNALQLLADAIKQEHTGYIRAQGLPPLPLKEED